MKFVPKPNFSNAVSKKLWSKESKDFSISIVVKWTDLGQIFKNPKMQILTPAFCCFFTKNVKMKINHSKTFI